MNQIIELLLKVLSQMGVTLTRVDVSQTVPQYYLELNKDNLIQSVEETLKSAYGLLWVLSYGKVSDNNRNFKINLFYEVIGEGGKKG